MEQRIISWLADSPGKVWPGRVPCQKSKVCLEQSVIAPVSTGASHGDSTLVMAEGAESRPVIPKRDRLASDWAIVATLLYLMLAMRLSKRFSAIRHYNYGSPERLAPIWY